MILTNPVGYKPMIIDKVKAYWTQEELDTLARIRQQQDSFVVGGQIPDENSLYEWDRLEQKAERLKGAVEDRYIADRKPKGLLEDAVEIIQSITREDYQARVAEQKAQIATLRAEGAKEGSLDVLRKLATENYDNCYSFILHYLRVQLNGLVNDEHRTEKLTDAVEKRVALWYVKPTPNYFPMAHGKATDALAFMSSKNAEINPITKTATVDKFGVQLAILRLEELHTTLGISTDKLLSTAIATFTQRNDFRHSQTKELDRVVNIPLREYAELLGYDVREHETNTPAEAEAEKKRAKHALDNARKAIKKDLLTIQASALSWEEKVRGTSRDFESISLVTRVGIRNGVIQIAFSPEIAQYLADKNVITQYPTKLLRISGRKPTAYYIGRKLAEHYNIDNNQIKGTHDRISIKALLAVSGLPTYEEVQATDRGHWENRIKHYFEEALDELTREGILKNWEYTHAKGVPLTDEEASNITSYSDFEKLYLHFTPVDKVDHTDRIQAKQERKTHNASKKKRS